MKVCERCGEEIYTKDGENKCPECEGLAKKKLKAAEARERRRERDQVMRDLGLTKVRGAMGGVYWE